MKSIKFIMKIAVTALLLASCSGNKNETDDSTKTQNNSGEIIVTLTAEQFNITQMALGKVTPQLFSDRIQSTGMLDVPPEYKAAVSAYYGGTVKNLHLLVGQTVKKGATLFTLENPDYIQMQQDYLSAKSKLKYMQAEYNRQKTLLKENVASGKKYLKAESDYKTMQADVNALSKKLRLLNINAEHLTSDNITTYSEVKAPIGGFITRVNITRGQYLSPNEVAVAIVNTEHMHLELNVFEKDITKVKKGQPIRFRLPENGTRYFEGEVFLTGRAVYPESRGINVHGHLKNEIQEKQFIPGMYIEAEILVDQVRRPALPSDAVVELDGTYYVLLKKAFSHNTYTFVQQRVQVGVSNYGYTQILNADVLGDSEVLIKGAFDMIQ